MRLAPEPPEEIKDLDNLKPIDHAVVALPHTPVYKMHRYFARRPWSVFHELIKHYSNPGSIVLDPFCGGGVTVAEGLSLGRKVVGVDFNPLATFVTVAEVVDINLEQLREAFGNMGADLKEKVESLYVTTCPKCKHKVPADWFEWSNLVECTRCKKAVQLSKAARVGKGEKIAGVSAGEFRCYHKGCGAEFRPAQCSRLGEVLVAVHCRCSQCGETSEFEPADSDSVLGNRIAREFEVRVKREELWYPTTEMPDWWDLRRPYNNGSMYFTQWETPSI